jgi:two-component system nitrate/nitrite response regulator NarL
MLAPSLDNISRSVAPVVGLEPCAIRVFIVGDQRLLADAVAVLIGREHDMEVLFTGGWRPASARIAGQLRPDVVLVDFHLRGYTAARVATALWQAGSRASVVFLIPGESDACRIAALEAGASAVVDVTRPASELIATVRNVARRVTAMPSLEITRLLRRRRLDLDLRNCITHREMEILELLAMGVSSREMARRLDISYATVRTHMRNLAGKLDAHSKLEVLAKGRQRGLIADWPSGLQSGERVGSTRPARRRAPVVFQRALVISPIESDAAYA